MLRIPTLMVAVGCFLIQPANGQTLRNKIENIFSSVLEIQLAGPGQHGRHFRPANVAVSAATIGASSSFITTNISSFPLGSTQAGLTFDFSGGRPVPTSTSMGPIFSERAQTIGRGRFNVAFNFNFLNLAKLRGLETDAIRFTFTHQDVAAPGLGDSPNEFDTIDLRPNLDLDATILAFFATVGITNRLDFSIAVPYVNVSLQAEPLAELQSFTFVTNDTANHSFGEDPTNPVLTSRPGALSEDATGVGDIALRAKYHILRGKNLDLAGLLEYRLPTGDEDNFLGTGSPTIRAGLVASSIFGDFGPHLNLAYEHRGGSLDLDEIELFLGYDQKLAEKVTFAFDLLAEFEIGAPVAALQFQQTAHIERRVSNGTLSREVSLTNLPSFNHDHNINASLGLKYNPRQEIILIGNVMVPLNDGGLRSDFITTAGFQVGF